MPDFDLNSFSAPTFDMANSFMSADFEAVMAKESTFGFEQSKPMMAGQDIYFSTFMSSLHSPQYTV